MMTDEQKPGWDVDGICNDHGRYLCADCALPGAPTPEPAQPAESPEALLAHLQRMPMTEWVWTDAQRIFAVLAASTARPTERGAVEGPTKEWCLNMARLEGNQEIGAGMPDHPLRAPGTATDQAAEAEAIGTLLRRLSNPMFQWSREQRRNDCLLIQRIAGLDTQPPTGSTTGGEDGVPDRKASRSASECEAVWRCAIGDATGAVDVLKNKWLASRRKNEREAGLVLGSVLDLVWAARSPAASNYSAAHEAGEKLIERVRAALQNGGE